MKINNTTGINQSLKLPDHPVPIYIIGAGGIVKDGHMPAYTLAGFPVAGIYDIDISNSKRMQAEFQSIQKVYDSLELLIRNASSQKESVYDIAVPAVHILPILKTLPNESAVLIQKPMGENLDQARQIREVCRTKRLRSAVNFQLRYAPYIIAARDLIDRGFLGKIYDMEFNVCVYTPWHLWDFLYDLPRVEILYHSIHYLDLIRTILGEPYRVYASTMKHPKMTGLSSTRSSIILDFDELTQARVMTNHGHDFGKKNQTSYLKIEGTKGAIKIRIGLSMDYPVGVPPQFEYYIPGKSKGWCKLALVGGWFPHAFIGTMAELQNFILQENEPLPHSTADAYLTMKLVEAVYQSSDTGGTLLENI